MNVINLLNHEDINFVTSYFSFKLKNKHSNTSKTNIFNKAIIQK